MLYDFEVAITIAIIVILIFIMIIVIKNSIAIIIGVAINLKPSGFAPVLTEDTLVSAFRPPGLPRRTQFGFKLWGSCCRDASPKVPI